MTAIGSENRCCWVATGQALPCLDLLPLLEDPAAIGRKSYDR